MNVLTDRAYMRASWALLAVFFLARTVYSGWYLLAPDEAYYWQWSRYPALGYHDHGPLIAWTIHLAAVLLGHVETAVRLPTVAAVSAASVYLVLMARRWFGAAAAFGTALASQSVLLFNVGALIATPDGLMAAAWAGACYHGGRAYEEDTWKQWLLCGFWFGVGMLSKINMVLFLPTAFLFGLCFSETRSKLAGIKPYVGVLLGVLIYSPVLLWNFRNDWSNVRHVLFMGGANEAYSLHLNYFGDYLASQAGLLSPLVFILVLWAWGWAVKRLKPSSSLGEKWLMATSLPIFLLFFLLNFKTRVYGNWPGFGFLTAIVLVAGYFSQNEGSSEDTGISPNDVNTPAGHGKWWRWMVATSYLYTGIVLLHAVYPFIPLPAHLDRTAGELSGWNDLGRKAAEMYAEMPDPNNTCIMAFSYQHASEIAFYAPGHPKTVSINRWGRPNAYDYWFNDKAMMGMDAVVAGGDPGKDPQKLAVLFERTDPPVRLDIHRRLPLFSSRKEEPPLQSFFIYRAYGFRGGFSWRPENSEDIRGKKGNA